MLGSSCEIDSCIYHFCSFLLELTWRYCPLFRVANHFFRGTPQNAVTDFVAVLPKNSIEKLFVSMDLIDQLRQGLVGWSCGCFLGLEKIISDPGVMDGGLRKCFSNDSRLAKFNSKTKMDYWM